jgi:GNAT superfamily N-acetyltransferase
VLEIEPLGDADLPSCAGVLIAAKPVDAPDDPVPSEEQVAGWLRAQGPVTHLVARRAGEVVGTASVVLLERRAAVQITVRPEHRGQGIGTALLDAVLPELRDRDEITSAPVAKGGAGERWAIARGFQVGAVLVAQRLMIADADPSAWDVPTPRGHQMEQWSGEPPAYVRASVPEQVRAELDAAGVEQHGVAVVRQFTGRVTALAHLTINPHAPDTARVLEPAPSELGRVTKAHLLRWLHVDRPAVARVEIRLPAAHAEAIGINEQLGFVTTGELVTLSRSS